MCSLCYKVLLRANANPFFFFVFCFFVRVGALRMGRCAVLSSTKMVVVSYASANLVGVGHPSMKKVKRAGGKGSLSASSIETRTTGKLHRVGEQIAASIVTPTNDTLLLNVTVRRTLRMALM